jgi:xylan 1,4-beta-xylosidase
MMKRNICVLIVILAGLPVLQSRAQPAHPTDSIIVDLNARQGALPPLWASFGYDEPNITCTPDGEKLLGELAALSPAPVYMRAHNLLTTGNGVYALKWGSTGVYTEDAAGRPVYSWKIMDSIFDAWVSRGMIPLAEIGFMPEALSTHPEPYRHHWKPGMPYGKVFTGWAYPPKDYGRWAALVKSWVAHAVARYGSGKVSRWYWEVWNEPNSGYWQGTREEYFKLYDYTAAAVKSACPGTHVGGPAVTGPGGRGAAAFLAAFLRHCDTGTNYATGRRGAPLDFISFHAKGRPRIINGHVRMNLAPELHDVSAGFRLVAGSRFKELPVFISEFDPEGCAACGMTTNPENAYRNGVMYAAYTAEAFGCLYDLAAKYHLNLVRATNWSFAFWNQPWFDGFRSLATHGIDKPVLNVFRMLAMMDASRVRVRNPRQLPVDSILRRGVHPDPDIGALAAAGDTSASVMVWNYEDDDTAGPASTVRITLRHIPAAHILVKHYRIDREHSNAYALWRQMGSPQQPTAEQYHKLEKGGGLHLMKAPARLATSGGTATLTFGLPREGVSLLKIIYNKP